MRGGRSRRTVLAIHSPTDEILVHDVMRRLKPLGVQRVRMGPASSRMIERYRGAVRKADWVVLIQPRRSQTPTTSFQLGLALALRKPVLILSKQRANFIWDSPRAPRSALTRVIGTGNWNATRLATVLADAIGERTAQQKSNALGQELRKLVLQKSVSPSALAASSGTSLGRLRAHIGGRLTLSARMLAQLVLAFGQLGEPLSGAETAHLLSLVPSAARERDVKVRARQAHYGVQKKAAKKSAKKATKKK